MDDADNPVVVQVDGDLYARYIEAKQAYDEVRDYLEGLKEQLREQLAAVGGNAQGHVGDAPICAYRRVTANRFNIGRFRKEFPDVYNQYTRPTSHWRLSFTATGDADA